MSDKKEKCFLFYERWYEQLKRLPEHEKLMVYESICTYAFEHVLSDMAYYLECIMDNIRTTIDENQAKQEEFLDKQKANGAKGGRPKECPPKPKKPTGFSENPPKPKKPYNKNKNKNKKEDNTTSSLRSEVSSTEPVDFESSFNDEKIEVKHDAYKESNNDYCRKVAEFFNAQMEGKMIPKIRDLTVKRKAAIIARTEEFGKEAIATAITNATNSRFLNGDNSRGFHATFDWIMRPNNFIKVLEGNYGNTQDNTSKLQRAAVTATSAEDYSTRL